MSDRPRAHLAIDLGAGGGRAILGARRDDTIDLQPVHRFHYAPRPVDGHMRWDFAALLDGILDAIRQAQPIAAGRGWSLESLGVDSWGVDYGFIDEQGTLLEDPVCYRDVRTRGVMNDVFARMPKEEIFQRTGIQFLELNTLYQLVAHVHDGLPPGASRLLMIPDLCHHALCGSIVGERTNASTTQLLGIDGRWDATLFERFKLPLAMMPEVVPSGTRLGSLLPQHQAAQNAGSISVIAPATHDTASAVVGTPIAKGEAYISSGTWSLVGVERSSPVLTADAAAANFTNEAGACGTTRFLTNVMGLWLLECCRKEWRAAGIVIDHSSLLERVAAIGGCVGIVFPDHPRFFNPPSMTVEIRRALAEQGQAAHDDPALLTKVILDSLALRYASVLTATEALTGAPLQRIHVVGGGSQNAYLNQATADASGREVVAGPVEATATGNILIQAMSCGEIASLSEARTLIAGTFRPRCFAPRASQAWTDAARRFEELATA